MEIYPWKKHTWTLILRGGKKQGLSVKNTYIILLLTEKNKKQGILSSSFRDPTEGVKSQKLSQIFLVHPHFEGVKQNSKTNSP